MLSALIKGNESYCCEDCLETVIAAGVKVQFQVHKCDESFVFCMRLMRSSDIFSLGLIFFIVFSPHLYFPYLIQCWESPNGTNEQRGQFPEIYIRAS